MILQSCIDDYSVGPNCLYIFFPNHIFSYFKTHLIPRPSANTCKVPTKVDPPFEICLYNGSYIRNGRLLHHFFLCHILISSGWRQNLFLAAWRGSLSEAADLNLEMTRYVVRAPLKKQPVHPKQVFLTYVKQFLTDTLLTSSDTHLADAFRYLSVTGLQVRAE